MGDRERLRAELEAHLPEAFVDGALDAVLLGEALGVPLLDPPAAPAFGLTWPGRAAALRASGTPPRGHLVADVGAAALDPDAERDVFVEGDNLEVLKLLRPSYAGRVKAIYIDPPYNAGTAYVYNDRFPRDDDDGFLDGFLEGGSAVAARRHGSWLSMLHPRLVVARELLAEDGVLLVSIGEDELRHLAMLLAEIFGEDNLAATFVWQKKRKPSFLRRSVGSLTEYVLAVTRSAAHARPFSVDVTTLGKKYPLNNAGNTLGVLTFPAGSVRFSLADVTVEPQDMSGGAIVTRLLDSVEVRHGTNASPFRLEGEWRYSQRTLEAILAAGEQVTIARVPFRPNHVKPGGVAKMMHNLLTPQTYGVGTNEDATAELAAVLGGVYFEGPKPTSLVRTLVQAVTYGDPQALVLDFFAGSGTTGHAVALLNAADGGRRRTVSVNLAETVPPGSAAARAGFATVADITRARLRWVAAHVEGALPLATYRLGDGSPGR